MPKYDTSAHRVLRVTIQPKLDLIIKYKGDDFVKAWLDALTCGFLYLLILILSCATLTRLLILRPCSSLEKCIEHGDLSLWKTVYDWAGTRKAALTGSARGQ